MLFFGVIFVSVVRIYKVQPGYMVRLWWLAIEEEHTSQIWHEAKPTSLIPGPVRCDMRQYQSYTRASQVWHEAIPVLYQDQSGVTWGNTSLIPGPVRCDMRQYQSYTRTSQVWPEAIPTSLIRPVPFWVGTWGKYKVSQCRGGYSTCLSNN
jgi:hypothetical protein